MRSLNNVGLKTAACTYRLVVKELGAQVLSHAAVGRKRGGWGGVQN